METDVLQRLEVDHQHIAAVVDALERELKGSQDDDRDVDWNMVSDMISYLQDYADAVHHPLEDQLFDRVLDKGLTPAERELVHFNLAQHAELIGATQQLAGDVDNVLRDIVVPVEHLEDTASRYIELQRRHMRNEGTHLFPLAQRLLSADDWSEISIEVASHADPMFDLQLEKYAGLYDYVTGR